MKRFWVVLGLGVATLTFWKNAQAQQPVTSFSGVTLFYEGSLLRSRVTYTIKSQLLRDGTEVPDPLNRRLSAIVVPNNIGYGITSNLSVVANIPFVSKRLQKTDAGQQTTLSTSGMGDILLSAKWRFLKIDGYRRTTQLALIGALELPTGSDDARDASGNLLAPGIQMGSGSYDYLAAFSVTQVLGRSSINGSLGYRVNTQGGQDFRAGNVFIYTFVVNHRIWHKKFPGPEFGLAIELNGEVVARAESNGTSVDNSGGHSLFLAPATFLNVRPYLTLEFAVQFPVLQNLNGEQLGVDRKFVGGIFFLFDFFL